MKKRFITMLSYFSPGEYALWGGSVGLILMVFLLVDRVQYGTLAASILGATSILFNAKGNPLGQVLMILFSVLYGVISWSCAYYGEMITYLGMTAPMAVVSLVTWLRNPFEGKRSEVKINAIRKREWWLMGLLALVVTGGFYFILKFFHTANLIVSTLSVTTSFVAAWLTFRRSPWFSLAYAANDVVLLVLWVMAAMQEPGYGSVVACFVAFLANDLYGFYSWRKMQRRQLAQLLG